MGSRGLLGGESGARLKGLTTQTFQG